MPSAIQINTPRAFEPLLQPARYKAVYGGRGCCHPDTPIDTPTGPVRIADFKGGPVYAWDAGKIVEAYATASVAYDEQQLYLVTLVDGRSISVTDQHRFLTQRGWVECRHLSTSDAVVCAPRLTEPSPRRSTEVLCQQASFADAQRLTETPEDYPGDCSSYFRQCDRQLHAEVDACQVYLQQPDGERQRSCHVSTLLGAQGSARTDTLSPLSRHLSTPDVPPEAAAQSFEVPGSRIDGRISEQLLALDRAHRLSHGKSNPEPPSQGFSQHVPAFDTRQNLAENSQKADGTLLPASYGSHSFGAPSCMHDLPILVKIESICKHDRLIYWDLHVPKFENYLSNGIVNHNSGKSHFLAELLVEDCLRQPIRAVCLREIQKSLKHSVKALIEDKIRKLGVERYFTIQNEQIICHPPGGGTGLIIFQGMQDHTAESIKSLEGFTRAWVEEAQTLSQTSLDLLRPTIRAPGSQLWFSWNPRFATDPVDMMLRGADVPPDAIVVKANFGDNPWFPEELQAEMEYDRRRDPDKYLHIWEGHYKTNSDAIVFKNWIIDDFVLDPSVPIRIGADWGFAKDPTAIVRMGVVGRRVYIDHEAFMVGCEIDQLPDLFDRIPDSRKFFITADSSRPETISYMRNHGFPKMNASVKGKGSVEEGIEFLKSFDIVVHPRCENMIRELTMYSYKVDKHTEQVLPILVDENNHGIDAARYALEGIRRTQKIRQEGLAPMPKTPWSPIDAAAGY